MIIIVYYDRIYLHVIYELCVGSRITTGLLYSIFGLRVPDDGPVIFYREIKFKMRFGVVHCCYYDKIYLQLIDIILSRIVFFWKLRRLSQRAIQHEH